MIPPDKKTIRIMVFGTFDMIHEGHKHFFKQARDLAENAQPFLIVSLARDVNVQKIKGKNPDTPEQIRLAAIAALPEVDDALLGAIGDHMPHIIQSKPDIIALGYDQTAYTINLKQQLKIAGLGTKIVRLEAFKPHIYKTSIIKAQKASLKS